MDPLATNNVIYRDSLTLISKLEVNIFYAVLKLF